MTKKFAALFLLIPLLSLTACFGSGDPQAPAKPSAPSTASATQQGPQTQPTSGSIESQMRDVNQQRGTINPQEQQKLNSNPVVPDAFKQ